MSFENIIGHRKALQFLRAIIETDNISSAYLFSGPDGAGKALVAKEFANSISSGYDIHIIEPEGVSKTISIKTARDISIKSERSPYEANRKVFIIVEAEHMTEEAANCLLKTLEEPPKDTVFMLTTSNITRLLPTIVSRCKVIIFGNLKIEEVAKLLTRHYGLDEGKANLLARLTYGKPGKAIRLLKEDWLDRRQELIESIAKGKMQGISELFKDREGLLKVLEVLQSIFRDTLFQRCFKDLSKTVFNLDILDLIKDIALKYSPESILDIIESLSRIEYYLRQNGNPRLALSIMELKLNMKGMSNARSR